MKLFNHQQKKLFSLILVFAMLFSIFSIMPFSVSAAGDTAWYVAGIDALCNGQHWVPGAAQNKMTYNEETGLYEITFKNVGAGASESEPFSFEFKVTSCTDTTWSDGTSYPNEADNYSGAISKQDDVKITFDEAKGEVKWYSDSKYVITSHIYRVAGASNLCGSNWSATDNNNKMTYNGVTERFEKVYTNKATGTYEYKITMDGSKWIPDGMNNNLKAVVTTKGSTITIWYDELTGKYDADITAPEEATTVPNETTAPNETTIPQPTDPPVTYPIGTTFQSGNINYSVIGGNTVVALDLVSTHGQGGAPIKEVVIPETVKYLKSTLTVTEVDAAIFDHDFINRVDLPATIKKAAFSEKTDYYDTVEISIRSQSNPFDEESSEALESSYCIVRVHIGSETEKDFRDNHSSIYVRYFELSGPQEAETFSVDGITYYVDVRDNKTAEVSIDTWTTGLTELTIPAKVKSGGIEFTVSAGMSFVNSNVKKTITKLTLEDGIDILGINALKDFTSLTDLYILGKDTSISNSAFAGLDTSKITIYGYTGSKAEEFATEKGIKFETIGIAVGTQFTDGAFTYTVTGDNTVKLKAVDISLTEVVIPETVKYNDFTFTVTDIDSDAVYKTGSQVTSLSIPGTIKVIPEHFSIPRTLSNLVLNEGIEEIDEYAFFNLPNIEKVVLPASLKKIEGHIFQACENIKEVVINSDIAIPVWSLSPFQNAPNINVYFYSKNNTFADKNVFTSQGGAVYVYQGSAVEEHFKTTNANIRYIGVEGPQKGESFTVDSVIYKVTKRVPGDDNVTVVATGVEENATVADIQSTVTYEGIKFNTKSINTRAFENSVNLTKAVIPEGVTIFIPTRLFAGCTSLKDVYVYDKEFNFNSTTFADVDLAQLTIYGYKGSNVEKFASENSIKFVALDAEDTTQPDTSEPDTTEPTTEPDTTEPTTEPITTAPVEIVEYVLGNVDGIDGVKIDDATKIQKYIVGLAELDYADLLAADVNADGKYDITDVTLIQMWIAGQKEADGLGIGEKFTKEVTPTQPTDPQPTDPQPTDPQPTDPQPTDPQPTDPQPTDPQPTDPQPTDPQPTDPQPTDPQPSDPDMVTFYVPNYVSWLTDLGGKMWIYNDATDEFELMDYDTDFKYFIIDLPADWTELSLYRTPFETTYDDFDINSPWSDETMSGCILNKWEHLGDRGDNNCFKITADGEGFYTMFDPEAPIDNERTIYFDNSKTQWSTVYIYGWSFGLSQEFVQMEPEDNDIWSYTFYDDLPVDGVKGFLFVNQSGWPGATQTNDVATEEGKNLFTPIPGGQKLNGSWSVYNP